ncbi:MAG: hypothetical protein ACE5DL_05675 [Nitrosopumilaceae archaeon]
MTKRAIEIQNHFETLERELLIADLKEYSPKLGIGRFVYYR